MHHVFNVKKEAGLHGDSLYLLLLVLFWKRYTIPKIYDKKVSILQCIHAQGFRERFLMYGIFKKSWVKKLWSRNTLNKIGLQQSLLPDTWFWWYAIWCSILYNTPLPLHATATKKETFSHPFIADRWPYS